MYLLHRPSICVINTIRFFFMALLPDSGYSLPLGDFAITLRHTTLGRTPLNKL